VAQFEEKFQIKGTLLISEELLQDPWSIGLVDSLLIISNSKGEPLAEVYDNYTGNFINSFLQIGSGPTEVLALSAVQAAPGEEYVFLYDLIGMKMLKVEKNSLKKKGENIVVEPYYNLNQIDKDELISKYYYFTEDYLLGVLNSSKGRLGLINKKTHDISYYIPITDTIDSRLNERQNAKLFSSDITISPDRKKVALSTHMADIIDIYEMKGNRLDSIWHYQTYLPHNLKIIEFENYPPVAAYTAQSRNGYLDITSSKENVYALFSGRKMDTKDYYYANIIRVVDWGGKETYELHVDYPLKRIVVDENGDKLYGIALNNGEFAIVEFNLKQKSKL
jgi:hypothetical protein